MKKEKYLFFYLFLFLLMTAGAFVWQMFFPDVAEKLSVWGAQPGMANRNRFMERWD